MAEARLHFSGQTLEVTVRFANGLESISYSFMEPGIFDALKDMASKQKITPDESTLFKSYIFRRALAVAQRKIAFSRGENIFIEPLPVNNLSFYMCNCRELGYHGHIIDADGADITGPVLDRNYASQTATFLYNEKIISEKNRDKLFLQIAGSGIAADVFLN